jgi:redox-sensitive bicupin YhaK (pirin superfamily)
MTSAGTGISHSEYSYHKSPTQGVHFLQIWCEPHTPGLTPKYFTRHFPDSLKTNNLLLIVEPVGSKGVIEERNAEGPTPIHSDVRVYASILEPGKEVEGTLEGKKGLIQVIQTTRHNEGPSLTVEQGGARVQATIRHVGEESQGELGEGDMANLHLGAAEKTEVKFKNVGEKNVEFLVWDIGFLGLEQE